MNEKLTDEHGIPEAYSMVKGLEKVENDINHSEGDPELIPYFRITANIREELTPYIGVEEGMYLQDLLLERKFEEAYDFLDEHWEESVRERVPDENIEGWQPEKPLRA
jgi:hypothetical protein